MLEERFEKWYIKTGHKLVIIAVSIAILYAILRLRIIGLFAPFIIAWIFSIGLNKVVSWLWRTFRLNRGIGTIVSMLTILSGVLSIISVLVKKLWDQIIHFSATLPQRTNEIMTQLDIIEDKLSNILSLIPGGAAITDLDTVIQQFMDSVNSFLSSIIPVAYSAVSKVPDIVLFIIVMLLATFFMTKDHKMIKDFVKAQFSDTIVDKIVIMQRGMIEAVGGYIRTQVILMCMTFVICLIGLFVLRIDYALLLAVIIGVVDALPVFGSGAILIPWSIYHLLSGSYSLALGLIAIYGVIFIMRQIMEPKILSSQIGVYALVTIMSVYIGYKVLGAIGLIVGPILMVTLRMLQSIGVLPKFKEIKDKRGKSHERNQHSSHNRSC